MSERPMADSEASVPPNVKEFSEITAVIFYQLYASFPVDRDLNPDDVAGVLGVSISDILPSGRTFNIIFINTLGWLICKIWYSISQTVSDLGNIHDRSIRAFAV